MDNRLPPGQAVTRDWPVLHYGPVPRVDLTTWRLRLFGQVESELALSFREVEQMPRARVTCDIHCVTRWSRFDNRFEGVRVRDLLSLTRPTPEARFVMVHAGPNWSTNLPLDDLLGEDVLLAWRWNGQDIPPEHGWPLRLVVPHLYFWKSAKWVTGLEFMAEDRPGFWERAGYHNRGNPWAEERYRNEV